MGRQVESTHGHLNGQREPLSRRAFLSTAGLSAPAIPAANPSASAGAARPQSGAAQRPNILMVLIDDQRWDAFSASGCLAGR
jgi:hypothetical protein